MGGKVVAGGHREFGRANLSVIHDGDLFAAMPDKTSVWMSHGDQSPGPAGGRTSRRWFTPTCPFAAVRLN
jgi:GMP synthase (glutamine-hydrolysing)